MHLGNTLGEANTKARIEAEHLPQDLELSSAAAAEGLISLQPSMPRSTQLLPKENKSKHKQLKAMPASLVYVSCIMGRVWFMVEYMLSMLFMLF